MDLTTDRDKNDRDGGKTGYLQHKFTDVMLCAMKWQQMKEEEGETWGQTTIQMELIYAL